ncbi:MAG TPA: sugar ABC transporter permease [Nocardioidaceae bacterium]|nr:sugar ABC transporter permease [Nocardioidaceae bacterium]
MADQTTKSVAADLADERLLGPGSGVAGVIRTFGRRVRSGELGALPVVLGLLVISLFFYSQEPIFLSSRQLVTITQSAAPVGIIALGVVLVLLLGEIDLSVGSVSGLSAAVLAWVVVTQSQSLVLGLLAGAGTGVAIGVLYGLLYTKVGVPSFVITLAGLMAFLGLQLKVLGVNGTVNLPRDSALLEFARQKYVEGAAAYVIVLLVVVAYTLSQLWAIRRRRAADLSAPSYSVVAVKSVLLAVGLGYLAYYLGVGNARGFGYLFLFFVALVVLMDLVLRKTRWGRHVFAVGGNEEAARRAGIKVDRIYISVFALTGLLASVGGLLSAAFLTSVNQSSGGTDTNLTAIAAAVIGGTSLFGGRGSAYAALLGILVLQSIQSGLNLLGVDSSVRFMVTGGVLLLAVAIDSVSRRARSSSGRG